LTICQIWIEETMSNLINLSFKQCLITVWTEINNIYIIKQKIHTTCLKFTNWYCMLLQVKNFLTNKKKKFYEKKKFLFIYCCENVLWEKKKSMCQDNHEVLLYKLSFHRYSVCCKRSAKFTCSPQSSLSLCICRSPIL
jgi:hypothetical protein